MNVKRRAIARLFFLECGLMVSVPRAVASGSADIPKYLLIPSLPLRVLTRSVKPAHCKKLPARYALNSFHAFLQAIQRRCVRDPNEPIGAESRAVGNDGVFLLKQFVGEIF